MTAQIKLSQQKKQKLKKVQGGREISVNMSKIPQYGYMAIFFLHFEYNKLMFNDKQIF